MLFGFNLINRNIKAYAVLVGAVEVLKIKIVSPIYDVKDHKITLLLAILSWRWQTMVQCRDCASTLDFFDIQRKSSTLTLNTIFFYLLLLSHT